MSSTAILWRGRQRPVRKSRTARAVDKGMDVWLLVAMVSLLALGLVMVGSASVSIADNKHGEPFYFLIRQAAHVGVGVVLMIIMTQIPLQFWQRLGPLLLLLALLLLAIVLLPGVGRTINGATRWIRLGFFNAQVSEFMKFALIVYLASYLVRRSDEVRHSLKGFLLPLGILLVVAILLLAQPDFGTLVVLACVLLGMLFLAGVPLWMFGLMVLLAGGLFALLAVTSPYRLERLTTFMNPWDDPFNSGFQLTQALIAFGRGDWLGVGLGGSVQKLLYLPEAHTDFLFAVLAEELGLFGSMLVVLLIALLVWRAFAIARLAAERDAFFAAYVAYGVGLLIGIQSLINLGVNMGVLPTKGLTLPLMSYGGSSILSMCLLLGLLLRADRENLAGGPCR